MGIFWRRNYYRWYTKLIHYENYDALLHVKGEVSILVFIDPMIDQFSHLICHDPLQYGHSCSMTSQFVIILWHISMIFIETWDEKLAWNSITQFMSLLLLILLLLLLNVRIRSSHLNTYIVCTIMMGGYLKVRTICLALPHLNITMTARGVAHLRETNYKECIKIF